MSDALSSKIGLALLLTVLGGCDAAPEQTASGAVLTAGDGYGVQEFTLKDGTQCAAIIGYQKAALTCDWSHKP
jgi:hypothetical protein